MDIEIRKEWFGIVNGLNSFINNRVMALDWCKNVFFHNIFLNIFRTNGWILINFVNALITTSSMLYLMHVIFGQFFNRVMALDRRQNFVMLNILWNHLVDFDQILYKYALILTRYRFGWLNNIFRSFSTESWPLIDVEISFLSHILWTNWRILIKFYKCIDIDKM